MPQLPLIAPQFNYDSKTLWRVRQEIRGEKRLSFYNNHKKNSVKTDNFWKTWGSHSSVIKDSVLLGHQTVLLSLQFLMLWMTVVPVCPASSWTVKMKALWSFEATETTHPVTQCHIPEFNILKISSCMSYIQHYDNGTSEIKYNQSV